MQMSLTMIQIAFSAFTQGLDLCNQPHWELSRILLGILFAVQTYLLSSRTLHRYFQTRCGGIEGMLLRPLAGFSCCLFTLMFVGSIYILVLFSSPRVKLFGQHS